MLRQGDCMQSKSPPIRFGRAASTPRRVTRPKRRNSGGLAARGQWSRLSWPLSIALFVIPAALLVATFLAPRFATPPEITIRVADRYSGAAIPAAEIVVDGQTKPVGPDGSIPVLLDEQSLGVQIQAEGYEAVTTTLTRGGPPEWQVALRPNILAGRLTDAESSAGIAGVEVSLVSADGAHMSTMTSDDGSYAFTAVPADATIRFTSADYGAFEEPVGERIAIDRSLTPTFVTGQILDADGVAVANARVAASNGTAETMTGADGSFRLTGGTEVGEVLVSAAGFEQQTLAVDASRQVLAQLEPEMIKAIYANLGVLGDQERWNRLLEIADTTEINAIVIDVKQDTIYYDTQVPFFRNVEGMVTPVLDMESIVNQLHERGLYAIARMVVFKDPVVAAGRPDLAVQDEVNGGLWLDMNGTPWVNAFEEELWAANADLAVELAGIGFDEIQYDYIRLPSDGDLKTADFKSDYSEASRRAAITGAVALASERVRATGARFAIDLFPIIALMGDDQGIGQTLQDLTPYADYVNLMIYPSHYEYGNIPVDGHPNDFPAETVTYTLERVNEVTPGVMKKHRPWLQDFTYPLEGYSEYGPAEVREQIDAAEAMGVSGWILWNAAGEFQAEALKPE